MKLSRIERAIIANQFRILEQLEPELAEDYEVKRKALENGYELEYESIFETVYDVENSLSSEDCQLVYSILIMYTTLKKSYEELSETSGVEKWQVTFKGFDGNNEVEYMAYCQYLVDDLGKFQDLDRGDDFDSHAPFLSAYKRMLDVWERYRNLPYLTFEQIKEIVSQFKSQQ